MLKSTGVSIDESNAAAASTVSVTAFNIKTPSKLIRVTVATNFTVSDYGTETIILRHLTMLLLEQMSTYLRLLW